MLTRRVISVKHKPLKIHRKAMRKTSTAKLDSVWSSGFDDAHEYVLMLLQVQRLQRPQHAIFVHGIDLERHATIVQPKFKRPKFALKSVAR